MDTRAHTPALPMELVRPYLLIACIAFATGFLAFVALGRSAAPEAVSPMTLPAAMSAPVPPAELAPETFV